MLTFRKGGKLATDKVINLNGEPLVNVSHFNYLGVVLQTRVLFHPACKIESYQCNKSYERHPAIRKDISWDSITTV